MTNIETNMARIDDDKTGLHGVLVLECYYKYLYDRNWKPERYLEELKNEQEKGVEWNLRFIPDDSEAVIKINHKEYRPDMGLRVYGNTVSIMDMKSPDVMGCFAPTDSVRKQLVAMLQPALDRIDREAAKAISYRQTLAKSLEVAKEMAAKWGETAEQLEEELAL